MGHCIPNPAALFQFSFHATSAGPGSPGETKESARITDEPWLRTGLVVGCGLKPLQIKKKS